MRAVEVCAELLENGVECGASLHGVSDCHRHGKQPRRRAFYFNEHGEKRTYTVARVSDNRTEET